MDFMHPPTVVTSWVTVATLMGSVAIGVQQSKPNRCSDEIGWFGCAMA
jgi:hypothetical protein